MRGDAPGELGVEGDDAGGLAAEGLGEVGVVEVEVVEEGEELGVEEEVGDDDGDVLEDAAYEQHVVTRQEL